MKEQNQLEDLNLPFEDIDDTAQEAVSGGFAGALGALIPFAMPLISNVLGGLLGGGMPSGGGMPPMGPQMGPGGYTQAPGGRGGLLSNLFGMLGF